MKSFLSNVKVTVFIAQQCILIAKLTPTGETGMIKALPLAALGMDWESGEGWPVSVRGIWSKRAKSEEVSRKRNTAVPEYLLPEATFLSARLWLHLRSAHGFTDKDLSLVSSFNNQADPRQAVTPATNFTS